MRKLALLLLLALPLSAADFRNIIVRDGDHSYVHIDGNARDLDHLGRHFAYFERDGVAWLITDDDTLDELERVMRPQAELGEEQARLGREQAELGRQQAALGAKQAAIGAEQAHARGDRARELQRRQRELADEQRELAEQQRPLAAEQRRLGEKQREAGRIARAKMERIFARAISTGVAKRR